MKVKVHETREMKPRILDRHYRRGGGVKLTENESISGIDVEKVCSVILLRVRAVFRIIK